MRRTVREYLTSEGENPFRAWLVRLDTKVRARLQARVLRFEVGNLGDHKALGDGVWKARVDFGPGYRIYFGQVGPVVVVLLCGGDKATQTKDVKQAKAYWKQYLKEQDNG
ncbi:MAG TPA: type II toxin-antitoxin system RelE/ParE family toxin [Kofleriaceae bacterium]